MPIYDYQCKTCNQKTNVLRKISESDSLPLPEELVAAGIITCTSTEGNHVWEKIITRAPNVAYGGGWSGSWSGGGGKGKW
jgi:predicted nucleic acid-binding Zn ribbon protein